MRVRSTFQVEPLDATFGAVVTDIELADLDEATFDVLYATWLEYALLIFPGQHLTTEEQVEFAQRFGDTGIYTAPMSNVFKPDGTQVDGDEGVLNVLKGNRSWHCDATFMPVMTKGSVMTARAVPSAAGETGWADMAAAYDALDEETRARISDLSAYHSMIHSQSRVGHKLSEDPNQVYYFGNSGSGYRTPTLRPLAKVHPETGRAALLIGRHAYSIAGMESDESERYLQELVDFACQPPRTYHHSWSLGDAVLFDNRRLLHRARPWDMNEERTLYIVSIEGDPKTEFAAHA